ncbi:MAG: hypothetical protein HC829_00445 [Bacteroidales bacterium]|nr:hypothetical protein [Bacteroidales bacterium]
MPDTLPSPTDKLTARIDGHIGWLVLDNPARRNALTLAMWQAVPQLVAALDAWIRDGVEPPASVYPRLSDRTLVDWHEQNSGWPKLPNQTNSSAIR